MSSCQPPKRGKIGRLPFFGLLCRPERLFSVSLRTPILPATIKPVDQKEIQSSKRKSQGTVGFRRVCVEDTHCQTAEERATLSGLEDEGGQNTAICGIIEFPPNRNPRRTCQSFNSFVTLR